MLHNAISGLSLGTTGPEFSSRKFRVEIMMKYLALGRGFALVLRDSPVRIFPPLLLTDISFVYHRRWIDLAQDSDSWRALLNAVTQLQFHKIRGIS
jgi:hypothetical protein